MKKNNKILNKLITGFLAFAMVLTGAMSLGTMKKHTASADMADFVSLMALDIIEIIMGNEKACLIIDNQLIENVDENSRINNLERREGSFLGELAQNLGISCTSVGFRNANFYIFAQHSTNNDQYVNLVDGGCGNFSDVLANGIANISEGNPDFSTNTTFFGAMRWDTNQEIIGYFSAFKNELGEAYFTVYAYEKESFVNDNEELEPPTGENGLQVQYYVDGSYDFEDRML